MDATTLKKMLRDELQTLTDPRVLDNLAQRLCEPRIELFDWSYADAQYPCWIVLEDDPANSDTGIVYCEQGFGPRCPWGLMWLTPENGRREMGQDSDWYTSFLKAYWESRAPIALPIWRVFELNSNEALSGEMAWEKAWDMQKELQSRNETSRYYVRHEAYSW